MGHSMDLLRLGRVHTAAATAAIPGLACHLAGGTALPVVLVTMGAFLHHAWGFSLNEIMDLDVDRKVRELSDKPLVSGRVGRKEAVIFSIICLVVSFSLFIGAAVLSRTPLVLPMVVLMSSTISGSVYDILGKRFPLSDVFVSLWMLLLVLAAGLVGGDLGLPVLAVALLSSVHILFNNSVEGGLKDVENDRRCNVPTLAVVTRCTFNNGKLALSFPFFLWAVILRGAFLTMASVFAHLISDSAGWGDWFTVMVSLAGFLLFMDALRFLRGGKRFDRKRLLRTFAVHEMASFALSLLVVLPMAGPFAAIAALALPILWFLFVNRVIFGANLTPKV